MGDYEWDHDYGGNDGYDPYQNYYSSGRKPKKKHTGLVVVLALLTGAASWAVNVLGLRVDLGQDGMMLAIGEQAKSAVGQAQADLRISQACYQYSSNAY